MGIRWREGVWPGRGDVRDPAPDDAGQQVAPGGAGCGEHRPRQEEEEDVGRRRAGLLAGRGEPPMDAQTAEEIVRAISSLSYGQVVLLVQDGRVVQIERTEKLRLR